MKRVVIYRRAAGRGRLVVTFLGSLLLVVGGFLHIIFGPQLEGTKDALNVLGGILLFGLCSIFALRQLLKIVPAIILDEAGITDRVSYHSVGFIPWTDVEDVELKVAVGKHAQAKYLVLVLHKPDFYLARSQHRDQWPINYGLSRFDVCIPDCLPVKLKSLLNHINRFRRTGAR